MKMWSGRFREPLDAEFEKWQRSIVFDWQLLDQEIAASKAHARALLAAGILTAAELTELRSHWTRLRGPLRMQARLRFATMPPQRTFITSSRSTPRAHWRSRAEAAYRA